MQLIGTDPRTGEMTIWLFESDGGALGATNILARVNNDTITWQPINLTIDDEEIGNLPPVKVTRVKAAK